MRTALCLVLLGVISAMGVAPGSADPTDRGVANKSISPAAAAATETYWTPERMAKAKPVNIQPQRSPRVSASQPPAPAGPVVTVRGVAGAIGTNGAEALAARRIARPYTELPDRLNVKIFFSDSAGSDFVCSGTIVNSVTKRMVVTAGHCVSDGAGSFHLNVMIVPGYASDCDLCDESRPFDSWTARDLTVLTDWHRFSNFEHDVGFIIVNDDVSGQRIVNRLGGQGIRFNAPRSQFFRAYGYPSAAPFNGFSQFVCPSRRLASDNPHRRPGPLTTRISCNLTPGASGGGWLINQRSTGLGLVNSVNSYKYVSGPRANPNHMYGPYFGSQAQRLYNFTVGLG